MSASTKAWDYDREFERWSWCFDGAMDDYTLVVERHEGRWCAEIETPHCGAYALGHSPDEARKALVKLAAPWGLPVEVFTAMGTRIEPVNPWRWWPSPESEPRALAANAVHGEWVARLYANGIGSLSRENWELPAIYWCTPQAGGPRAALASLRRITAGCTAIPLEVHAMLAHDLTEGGAR